MQTVKIPTFQRKTDPITMYYASIVLAMWNNDLMRHKLRTSFPAYNPCLGKQKTNNLIAKTQARTINCVCWINYAATLRKFSVFLPVRNLHLHIRRCFCLQKRKRDDERKKREKRLNDRQLGAIGLNVHHKSLFLLYVDGAQFNQLLWYLLFLNIQKKKM